MPLNPEGNVPAEIGMTTTQLNAGQAGGVYGLVAPTDNEPGNVAITGTVSSEGGVVTAGVGAVPVVYAVKASATIGNQAQSTTLPVAAVYRANACFGVGNAEISSCTIGWYDLQSGKAASFAPQLVIAGGTIAATVYSTTTATQVQASMTPVTFQAAATTFSWGFVGTAASTVTSPEEFAVVVEQLF